MIPVIHIYMHTQNASMVAVIINRPVVMVIGTSTLHVFYIFWK